MCFRFGIGFYNNIQIIVEFEKKTRHKMRVWAQSDCSKRACEKKSKMSQSKLISFFNNKKKIAKFPRNYLLRIYFYRLN